TTSPAGVLQVAFAQMPDLTAGSKPLAIVAVDVDNSGQLDLVTVNSSLNRDNPNTLQVVRNALPSPASSTGACCTGSSCILALLGDCAGSNQRFAGYGLACNAAGNARVPCCKGDFDQSGTLALIDIFAFLNTWFAGGLQADTNLSGHVEVQDIFDFLNAWFGG